MQSAKMLNWVGFIWHMLLGALASLGGALIYMDPFAGLIAVTRLIAIIFAAHGVTLRCLNVESFDDWTRSIAYEPSPSLGLATIFFPMTRVERMFLDERVGEVESLRELFERRVGRSVEGYLHETGGDA